jgi:hypothetical protein
LHDFLFKAQKKAKKNVEERELPGLEWGGSLEGL